MKATFSLILALAASFACYGEEEGTAKSSAPEDSQVGAPISKCEAPPFGEKVKDYKETISVLTKNNPSGVPQKKLQELAQFAYKQSCYVKSNGSNKDKFRALDVSDEDIESMSITSLALKYWSKEFSVYIQNYVMQAKTISVQEFSIDGPSLAKKKSLVEISGWYVGENNGNMGSLYSNSNDFLLVKYSNVYRPSVPLLLDDASHNLRKRLLSCQADFRQQGCLVTLRGVAIICEITNGYGVSHQEPCINAGIEPNEDSDYLPN